MKPKRILEELPDVPVPITEHLAEPSVSTSFPAVEHLPPQSGATAATGNLAAAEKKADDECVEEVQDTDSLLALAGTVKCDFSAIELAPVPQMREVPQDPGLAKHATTPLLALAGTLECDVTDISERHDEYIVDTLVTELRGNDDE